MYISVYIYISYTVLYTIHTHLYIYIYMYVYTYIIYIYRERERIDVGGSRLRQHHQHCWPYGHCVRSHQWPQPTPETHTRPSAQRFHHHRHFAWDNGNSFLGTQAACPFLRLCQTWVQWAHYPGDHALGLALDQPALAGCPRLGWR